MATIDLNSDLGESFGCYKIGNDIKVIPLVSSVNIACGFHAGDPIVMEETVKVALENYVAVGAHPGFPDLLGFGRRNMIISPQEAKAYIIYQVSALNGFIKALGGKMQHVKPHGALYNMAAKDYELARAIAEGVYAVDNELILMGLSGHELIKAGEDVGLQTASEVFADRAYTPEGTLACRSIQGSVIHDKDEAAARVVEMVTKGQVTATDGKKVKIKADSVCVHGDNQEALELVKNIRNVLKETGIEVKALR